VWEKHLRLLRVDYRPGTGGPDLRRACPVAVKRETGGHKGDVGLSIEWANVGRI
jgi:hypothetical protein